MLPFNLVAAVVVKKANIVYCKTLIIRVHLIFAKFTNSLKSRN